MAPWRAVVVATALLAAGCSGGNEAEVAAKAPVAAGAVGEIVRRAVAAEGGIDRWRKIRDVSYISTLTVLDPASQTLSERVGWFRAPLHKGALARMDSIGLNSALQFGIDAGDTWLLRDGALVEDPDQLAVSRFELVSSLFWFSLPFALVETPAQLADEGEVESEDGKTWRLLRATFDAANPGIPGKWFVLYFDTATWRLDRVHAQLRAPFLRHELWVVEWGQYAQHDGLWIERERRFYPADFAGEIVGPLIAQQLIEHVRLDQGEHDRLFRRPSGRGEVAAQESRPERPRRAPPLPAPVHHHGFPSPS